MDRKSTPTSNTISPPKMKRFFNSGSFERFTVQGQNTGKQTQARTNNTDPQWDDEPLQDYR